MAEAPKVDPPKDPKTARQPKLRYQDRPEIGETFADSIRSCVFDGQLMRIEFQVVGSMIQARSVSWKAVRCQYAVWCSTARRSPIRSTGWANWAMR